MALSIVKRPYSPKIDDFTYPSYSASVTNLSGIANFYNVGHALSSNDCIYVTSDYKEYNGFWFITKIDNDNFKIAEYYGGPFVEYIYDRTITYYRTTLTLFGSGWNAVHNPIVYKLSSTLWPTNSVDTARTVSSYSNDLGYAKLTLSGSLGTISELEFVKVTFTGGETAVYQVLTWYSNSIVTINLPYEGGLTFVSVQKYYTDYHAKIRVYAGLNDSHTFYSIKPLELITEIKAVPDSDGIITININEHIKSKIDVLLNNSSGGTLPNDITQFCQFYISYAEAYSYAIGGYTIQDYVGSYQSDYDTGVFFYAVNASLPFKNIYSGTMSEYMPTTLVGGAGNFLTGMTTPYIFSYTDNALGQLTGFFDVSFIIPSSGYTYRVRKELYRNGQIVNVVIELLTSLSEGIYRYQVSRSNYLEDRIDVIVQMLNGSWYNIIGPLTIQVDDSCGPSDNFIDLSWKNYLGGMDYWRFKSLSEYGAEITNTTEADKNFYPTWPNSWGEDADTLRFETSRESVQTLTVRAENLTETQVQDLFRIKLSPLVQIVNSRTDRRTVIPDRSSFVYFKEGEKNYSITLNLTYTDKFPAQSL